MLKDKLSFFCNKLQRLLFPCLEDEFSDPLLESHKKLAAILEIVQIERFMPLWTFGSRGRPLKYRTKIARAFIAKHVLNLHTTAHLIYMLKVDKNLRYICGWQPLEKIPVESTFSRVFAKMAQYQILKQVHRSMVEDILEDHLVLHCGRDSVPVAVRERLNDKKEKPIKKNKKQTVCEQQAYNNLSTEAMMNLLPTKCDIGKKVNSSGNAKCWRGYKLHMDVAEGWLPMSCIITSASTHDSQAAIPMSKISSSRAKVLYELMDSAYDVTAIKDFICSNSRVPLIKEHLRNGKRKEMLLRERKARKSLNWEPAESIRLQQRFSCERLFARLSDSFSVSRIWVRGYTKVMCQVMLGVISLTADEILCRLNI